MERAGRFHFERDAARYIVGRALLRRIVASYLGAPDPRDVTFSYGPHGKPDVNVGSIPGTDTPRFNIAHSGGFALFAFARAIEIGVDVERIHHLSDLHSVMRSCFASGERDAIAALPSPDEQHEAFFRCWTRKEAVLKALGSGLAKPLDSFEVSLGDDHPRLLSMNDAPRAPQEWRLLHLRPAPGFVGAAAWIGSELNVECFRYVA